MTMGIHDLTWQLPQHPCEQADDSQQQASQETLKPIFNTETTWASLLGGLNTELPLYIGIIVGTDVCHSVKPLTMPILCAGKKKRERFSSGGGVTASQTSSAWVCMQLFHPLCHRPLQCNV